MASNAFRGLTKWAFETCDVNGNGDVGREELYAGILLVHLQLAKYVGVAACQPLNYTQVDELFELANQEGAIKLQDFEDIVVMSFGRISSRIMVYYTMLLLLAPFLTARVVDILRYVRQIIGRAIHYRLPARFSNHMWIVGEWLVEHCVSVLVLAVAMPWLYSKIDFYSNRLVKPKKKRSRPLSWWR